MKPPPIKLQVASEAIMILALVAQSGRPLWLIEVICILLGANTMGLIDSWSTKG